MLETLPWSWYADPDVLADERRVIFSSAWQYAGHAAELARPGDYVTTTVGAVPLAVLRDEARSLRAFVNVCRHRGAEVASGSGNRRTLQCPYHAWTYRLDGSLARAPRSEREGAFDGERVALRAAQAADAGPFVFVNPDPDAPALAELAAGPLGALAAGGIELDTLVFDRRVDFSLEANWKVVIENYLECYHCPTAHPGFSSAVDVHPDRYVLETGGWTSSQYSRARDGRGPVAQAQFHFLWPTTRINVFPGSPNVSIGATWPVGPERTAGFYDYFFAPETPQEEIEELIALDAQVGAEDRRLVESVQRGVRSGVLDSGTLLPESEQLIAHFHGLVREALES